MVHVIEARERSVGGLKVLRSLPTRERRSVGPFVFLDELGPLTLPAGKGLDVSPHPHIGLSTLTYRLQGGELVHRDSLGCTQAIHPGAVNWMTAGSGVTHSERSGPSERDLDCEVHGVQLWVALPPEHEQAEPSFEHHPGESLPRVRAGNVDVRLIAGSAFGEHAPVRVFSPLFCAEAVWSDAGELDLPASLGERAAYPLVGAFSLGGASYERGSFVIFEDSADVRLRGEAGARVLLLGGERRSAPLFMHWNYVASDEAYIQAAKRRWASGGFGSVVGDDGMGIRDPQGD